MIYALARNLRAARAAGRCTSSSRSSPSALLLVVGALAYFVLEFNNPATFGGHRRRRSASCRASSSRRWRAPAASRRSTSASSTARACSSPTCSCSSAAARPRPPAASRSRRSPSCSSPPSPRRAATTTWRRSTAASRSDVLRLAVSVVLWGATIVAASTHRHPADHQGAARLRAVRRHPRVRHLRAVDRVHRRARPTPRKYVLAATMFLGRIGTVTLAAALAASQRRAAVPATRREAHRWLTGSRTTHPSS